MGKISHPDPQQVSFLAEKPIDLQWAILKAAWLEDELGRRTVPAEEEPLLASGRSAPPVPEGFPRLPVATVLEQVLTLPGVTLEIWWPVSGRRPTAFA